MTFEEFFTKKRIDLVLLQRANPILYEEFRLHYAQMGEKSFDHTKKYWFNRLRKDFRLEVADIPKAKPVATGSAAAPEPAASVATARPAGFRPRFKPAAAKAAESTPDSTPEALPPQEETVAIKPPAPNAKPTGFKPRFKPGVTAGTKPSTDPSPDVPEAVGKQETEVAPSDKSATPAAKPVGFKPRFKAGSTPVGEPGKAPSSDGGSEAEQPESTSGQPAAPVSKPVGFKPRFKAGKTTNRKDDAT